jgi:hypothetical protein
MYEPEDLERVIDYHQAQAEEIGRPPHNLGAWRAACKREVLENERKWPGHIRRSSLGIQAHSEGKRLTYCKLVRGTHGLDYIYDPEGTDDPPAWWNRDAAKLAEEKYQERQAELRSQRSELG